MSNSLSSSQSRRRPSSWLLPLALVASHTTLAAQCELDFRDGPAFAGPRGLVRALALQANGNPVVGGDLLGADNTLARGIARWNGARFEALGDGLDNTVLAISIAQNGDILAGGNFQNTGASPLVGIGRWNGVAWQSLGGGLSGVVSAIAELPDGRLIAGASQLDGTRVLRYDGTAWTPLGAALGSGTIQDLQVLPNGDIVAAGSFEGSPGSGTDLVVRWDGSTWQPLGSFSAFGAGVGTVLSLQLLPNGSLALGGDFRLNGVNRRVAIWDGTTATALAAEPPVVGQIRLALAANGDLIAGLEQFNIPASLWRWDGIGWTALPNGGPLQVERLAVGPQGEIVAVDSRLHSTVSTVHQPSSVHRFDGQAWSRLGAEVPPRIQAMVALPNGDVVAGGQFERIGGIAARNIAQWNGTTWAPLGLGLDGIVTAMSVAADGSVVVAGGFSNAGGAPAQRVARWNGTSWFTLGGGLAGLSTRLAAGLGGEVLSIGGGPGSQVWRFDGASWAPVPFGIGLLNALVALPDGRFVVGGRFDVAGQFVAAAIYDNGVVTPLVGGAAPINVRALVAAPDGAVFALSQLGQPTTLLRWAGGPWQQLATITSTSLLALAQLPDGDLVVGGSPFTIAGVPFACLARFDGNGFGPIGAGVSGVANAAVSILAASERGELWAVGSFTRAGDEVAAGSARFGTACPAAVQSVGAGCIGASGPVSLAAGNRPWLGGEFRTVGTGLPSGSLALQVVGVATAVAPLPLGAPGCSLFVDPLLLDLLVPQQGAVAGRIAVPAVAAIVGLDLFAQVIGLELDASGALARLTGSNALRGTVGAL